MKNNITCTVNCKKQNSCNTLYPTNMIYFRCLNVNTLRKVVEVVVVVVDGDGCGGVGGGGGGGGGG
jgi:hypothetical protein